jgi:hypothetical protein
MFPKKSIPTYVNRWKFACPICNGSFKKQRKLERHLEAKCPGNKLWLMLDANAKAQCLYQMSYPPPPTLSGTTKARFKKANQCSVCADFEKHILGSHRTRGSCLLCDKTFETVKDLKAHMPLHAGDKGDLKCVVCGIKWPNLACLKVHLKNHI